MKKASDIMLLAFFMAIFIDIKYRQKVLLI